MNLLVLYLLFAKISLFTFGGGYAMVPLFQDELVNKGQYMSSTEFANLIALAQMTPGPIGLNAATYIGYSQGGFAGALAGTLGISTPPFILALLAGIFLYRTRDSKLMKSAVSGIRPAVLGLIATAVFFFAETSVFASGSRFGICWQGLLIFALTLFIITRYKLNMLWVLLLSAVLGVLLFLL